MWATSKSEEPAMAGLLQLRRFPVQPIKGADHLSQSGGTDAGIQHRGFDTFMPEKLLDVGQLRAMLQKMSGEAVAQSVGGNACAQACLCTESTHHPLHSLVRERLLARLAVEQPAFRPVAQEVAP